jgi:hypothetical protein
MKRTINYLSLAVALFAAGSASAYNEDFGKAKSGVIDKPVANTRGASCAPANYRVTMAFNDVSAQLETGGLLFLDRANGVATYRVPKTGLATAIYAGSLWMGGVDVNGQLKLAAVTFRNDGNDFWPGPLSTNPGSGNFNPLAPQGDNTQRDYGAANVTPETCAAYDKIFVISKAEVIGFITWWECNNPNPFNPDFEGCEDVLPPDNEVMARINAWPGNGNTLGGGIDEDPFLAPYYDRNQDLFYNAQDGDYPWYDDILGRDDVECGIDRRSVLFGDQTYWWVFNDKGNIHSESGAQDPIGMEIRAQAFAFATDDEINKMTFYNYELINRGTQTLNDTYFAQYIDADLGGYSDDYVGCDVSRGLGYCYNGDLNDETVSGKTGYGENPPAIGVDFFEGPYQDADGVDNPLVTTGSNKTQDALNAGGIVYPGLGIGYGDGIVDNERYGMRFFQYYTSTAPATQSDPSSASQFYNYMRGKWRFGDNMFYGGTGYSPSAGVTTIQAKYMFPDDSDSLSWGTEGIDPGFTWSEYDPNGNGGAGNPAGDRRFVQSAGPFTLKPGAVNNITVGIVYGRAIGDLTASVTALKVADTKAQALFDNCFRILEPPNAPVLRIQELKNELILMLDNPAQSNNYREEYIEEDKINIQDPGNGTIYDKFYRFEGYQIFQMRSEEATVADIEDESKARLVAQCDIKNGVSRLVNFEFDEELGFSIPREKVDGEDEGIRHTFRITEDQFASGSRTLVNHKTYYYIAVAYGYNNYKQYDPTDPAKLDGQKMPYLRSRINPDGTPLTPTPAVPHNPRPESGGTLQQAVYGQTPRITRLDGFGNGNNMLAFTQETHDQILETGYMEDPEYDYGAGPINIKVVDPLNLVGGYFECKFRDYADIDTASWVIYRYDQEGGNLIDSATSETTILVDNEQIVADWGVSVQIYQDRHYIPSGSGNEAAKIADPIDATIEFGDSSKRWLSFVQDDAALFPTNWIRTGTYSPDQTTECDPLPDDYLNPCCYADEVGRDPKEQYSKLLGGGITAHKVTGYQCDFMPIAYPESFPSFSGSRTRASLSFLGSVVVVLTKDKTKWTRCVVVELGRDENLNVNGGKPGELRQSPSKDKDGNDDGSGTMGMSWFPGYALDLETGARLHMGFGENSFLGGHNGADMIWNPTSELIDGNGVPVFGGQHPIYIWGTKVGYGSFSTTAPYYDGVNNWVYDQYMTASTASYNEMFESLQWIINPILTDGRELLETDVTIRVGVNKEYKDYVATGLNGGKPMYSWSMDDIRTVTASQEQLASALDLINVVPNPYYAFSEYERTRLDNRVKITNLPDQCTVNIYNVSGKLIRTFKKDNEITSIDWDLKNSKGIPIASGVYIIHVEVPGAGEKIIKFFGGMRQVDLENI